MGIKTTYNRFLLLSFVWMNVAGAYAQESMRYPVILSSRWFHPTSPQDTLSTIRMVELYHPDRIDWMYCTDAKQLAQLQARKVPYSLAINPQVPDSAGYTVHGRVEDLNGRKLAAPWMRKWKLKNPYWGCVNSPEFQKVFLTQSYKLIDLEAYGLFVDDARFNDHATEWGGCFCDHCITGFTTYLQGNGADTLKSAFNYRDYLRSVGIDSLPVKNRQVPLWANYRAFQTKSVVRFLTNWRKKVEDYARRPVTFLTNNYGGQWTEIYQIFDIGVAELPENRLNRNYILARTSEAGRLNKKQYFTLSSDDESKQLKALFLTYSTGSALIIPWDVYVHTKSQDSATRYYGNKQSFQPIYNLFQQEVKPSSKTTLKARNLRIASMVQINSNVKRDSISVYEYETTERKIIMVEAISSTKKHNITIKKNKTDLIEIIYPTLNKLTSETSDSSINVQFQDNLLVLSINNK
ncbi:hypothetical protein [Larkinella sp. C7]|jgi:hypothetical protein|uniref:hypothetical protein n=1 Tax=Larkinella sp. C7 TaxID=2576607 RepID=UPI001111465E|nr:hypothetical protein [Larkinella sp. C7]